MTYLLSLTSQLVCACIVEIYSVQERQGQNILQIFFLSEWGERIATQCTEYRFCCAYV